MKIFKNSTLVAIGSPWVDCYGYTRQDWLNKKIFLDGGKFYIRIDGQRIEVERLENGYFKIK